jgi:RNA polymerase sigma-70 factor, ECF subfamily
MFIVTEYHSTHNTTKKSPQTALRHPNAIGSVIECRFMMYDILRKVFVVAMQTDDLGTIIALAQRNDPGAYEHLYGRFVDQLYRYLYVRCNDPEVAEEVLGELWLRVVQHLPHFRIPAQGADQAFASWLYRIARNLSVDAQRYKRKYIYGIPEMIESPEPRVEDRIVAEDERQSLDRALTALTVEQREVILLRFHDERTISEVAALTGRTETAIKGLQHRAVGALARAMGVRGQKVTDANPI